jgi:hypothetical protein
MWHASCSLWLHRRAQLAVQLAVQLEAAAVNCSLYR